MNKSKTRILDIIIWSESRTSPLSWWIFRKSLPSSSPNISQHTPLLDQIKSYHIMPLNYPLCCPTNQPRSSLDVASKSCWALGLKLLTHSQGLLVLRAFGAVCSGRKYDMSVQPFGRTIPRRRCCWFRMSVMLLILNGHLLATRTVSISYYSVRAEPKRARTSLWRDVTASARAT